MRKLILLIWLLLSVTAVMAQTTTTTSSTPAASTSTVNIFYVACDTQGVINLDGNMKPGYDIYYQLFSGAGASGQALSALRRVSVDGNYAVSEVMPYNSGQTVASGSIGSVRVLIARESNSSSSTLNTTVDDIQDGCNSPQHSTITSVTTTAATPVPTGTIRSPFGGFLTLDTPPNPPVVIGVPNQPGRSNQPGVIFAECDQYPAGAPGTLYNDDNIVIFWSWFAKTPQEVQDHIDQALYDVKFQTAPLIPVQVSPIQKLGSNYWVFYTVPVGNLSPGKYGVNFKLRWANQITDGYEKFGPGTVNDLYQSTCTFEIKDNPFVGSVDYNGMYSLDR